MRESLIKAQQKYRTSSKGRLVQKRYRESDRGRVTIKLAREKRQLHNPEKQIWLRIRQWARYKNKEFNLEVSDIVIPKVCPILEIELKYGTNKAADNSPSVDRIDNSKGYVKGNIHIISYRANRLKGDGSLEELTRIVEYLTTLKSGVQ